MNMLEAARFSRELEPARRSSALRYPLTLPPHRYKICSHPSLILAKQDPASMDADDDGYDAAAADLKFAKLAFPDRIYDYLRGDNYCR